MLTVLLIVVGVAVVLTLVVMAYAVGRTDGYCEALDDAQLKVTVNEDRQVTRVNTSCLICESSVQTDVDQVPTLSDTFDELLVNFGFSDGWAEDHVHVLYYETVT